MEATVTTTRSGAASVFRVRSVSTLVGVDREELPATVRVQLASEHSKACSGIRTLATARAAAHASACVAHLE